MTDGQEEQCNTCHLVDASKGAFGTIGKSTAEGEGISQEFKVPHLRNMYQKVGRFGSFSQFGDNDDIVGDQIRGFGYLHDGSVESVDNFLSSAGFIFENDKKRTQVVDFVMVMNSDLAPIVGQQATLTESTGLDTDERIDLLLERAQVITPRAECDLIAKGFVENQARGFLFDGKDSFQSDKQSEVYTYEQLREFATKPNNALTFTCVPPGSGKWMGVDRNGDGVLDAD